VRKKKKKKQQAALKKRRRFSSSDAESISCCVNSAPSSSHVHSEPKKVCTSGESMKEGGNVTSCKCGILPHKFLCFRRKNIMHFIQAMKPLICVRNYKISYSLTLAYMNISFLQHLS
jgi:hypothetical protein